MKNEDEVNFRHHSGLVIERNEVVRNPIKLESTILPGGTKFVAEGGEAYFLSHLEDHAVSARGWIIQMAPVDQRWVLKHYNILHEVHGSIGLAVTRLYKPEYSMGVDSDIEFAIFGHVQIEPQFRGKGFGIPTYVAAQTTLPEQYRLTRTNNAKFTARMIWCGLSRAGLVDTSTAAQAGPELKLPKMFLKPLRKK